MAERGYFWKATNVRLSLLKLDTSQYAGVNGSFINAAHTLSIDQDFSASAVRPQ